LWRIGLFSFAKCSTALRLRRDHLRHSRVAAKLERRRILERTARGQADAKEKGVKLGRKPTLTPHQQKEAPKRLEAGETQRSSQSTISRLTGWSNKQGISAIWDR
jgi:DNA invertase Pin-like site-specific DNA recombinase